MKILKNFALITLLTVICVPTEVRPIPSMPAFVFSAASIIAGSAVFCTVFGYIPFLLLTRHDNARNFVKHQDDITSYSIALEVRKKGETSLIHYFTGSDYRQVISDTLTYLQTDPSFPEKFAQAETLSLTPCITLADEKTTQKLLRISISSRKNSAHTLDVERLRNSLIYRFKIPSIKTHQNPLPYVALGTTLTLSGFLGFFTLIPAAIIGIPLFLQQKFHYSSAQNFVNRQEDIASYSITVKIKRHVKTIKEQTFTGTDYQTVMDDALLYAHNEQIAGLRSVFKPTITLVDEGETYPLRKIVKKTLPKNATQQAHYWRRLAHALAKRFVIPANDNANSTNINRIAYCGLESGAWMLSPYVAVLPFLL
jgi:hypothetical protein